MTELELELLRDGFPLIDQNDEGPCCDDENEPGFGCAWKIDRVELPEPKSELDLATDDQSGLGPLGALASVEQSGGASLGADAGLSDLGGLLGAGSVGGTQAMAPLVMGLVYPDLKPLLEASIRKITLTVTWQEGRRSRELTLVQYLTNPQQGGLDPNAAEGLSDAIESLPSPVPAPTGGIR
jgi:general secretion pathway protein I